MDRRLLLVLSLLAVAGAGCKGKDASQVETSVNVGVSQTDEGGGETDEASPDQAHAHRPVIEGPETTEPNTTLAPTTSEPPLFIDETPRPTPRSAYQAAPSDEPVGSGSNPLRTADDPAPAETVNPLRVTRSFSSPSTGEISRSPRITSQPRMMELPASEPQFAPAAAAPGEDEAPIATAPPPPAADDPSFHSMAIQPPDARATGPAAPESAPQLLAAAPVAEFDVEQVFYGTDRAAIDPPPNDWAARFARFLPAGFAVLVTLCLGLVAVTRKSTAVWALVAAGFIVSTGLGYQATASTLAALRLEGKEGPRYTIERAPGGRVELGVCEVTIPRTHERGHLESPSILRLEVREDAAKHVVLSKTERLATEPFYELLRQRVQQSPRKELFVFVHGFNVQFEDAARRTAQIHHDLQFEGAPIFFSWPANNKSLLTYPADETTITWSTPHLKQFLLEVVQQSGAQSVNLIAHSMGNRALTEALKEIELEFRGQSRLFNHVVLAAPDIDAGDFLQIADKMQLTANHVTLYASSRDDALRVSQLLHRGPRAGDSGRGLVVVPGIDTIDVTAIDTSPWGHIYYGASDPVLQDLQMLFHHSHPPQERRWLSPAQRGGVTYWIFEATQTAARNAVTPH